ncbi:MAG: hypothetical protein IPH73_08985 [Rhodocyclales bacterium]|jgi:hypothetical protein|nr:hypothetical protein [Rhodocyclales bacterium]
MIFIEEAKDGEIRTAPASSGGSGLPEKGPPGVRRAEDVYSSRRLLSIQAVFWLRPPLRGLTFAALTLACAERPPRHEPAALVNPPEGS